MLFKKELFRFSGYFAISTAIAISVSKYKGGNLLLIPLLVYCIGFLYARKMLSKITLKVVNLGPCGESKMRKAQIGTVKSIMVIIIWLVLAVLIGWIYGVCKGFFSLYIAYKEEDSEN